MYIDQLKISFFAVVFFALLIPQKNGRTITGMFLEKFRGHSMLPILQGVSNLMQMLLAIFRDFPKIIEHEIYVMTPLTKRICRKHVVAVVVLVLAGGLVILGLQNFQNLHLKIPRKWITLKLWIHEVFNDMSYHVSFIFQWRYVFLPLFWVFFMFFSIPFRPTTSTLSLSRPNPTTFWAAPLPPQSKSVRRSAWRMEPPRSSRWRCPVDIVGTASARAIQNTAGCLEPLNSNHKNKWMEMVKQPTIFGI